MLSLELGFSNDRSAYQEVQIDHADHGGLNPELLEESYYLKRLVGILQLGKREI